MRKLYRKIFEKLTLLVSRVRIIHLKIKYPKLKIAGSTYIGKNCSIVCMDDSEINLLDVYISNNAIIHSKYGGKLTISGCYIGSNTVIVSVNSIIIEEMVEIAEMVVIRDQNHCFDFSDTPVSKQGFDTAPIKICSNTWIGTKATIIKGVIVGKNSVIGAHSLVNKNVKEGTLVVGIPARPVMKNIKD